MRVNRPGDKYEQEADRVAEQVMRMPEPVETGPQLTPERELTVQRQSEVEEEEEDELVQGKEAGKSEMVVPAHAAAQLNQIRSSGGQPLPAPVRQRFEPRFGHDFSQVRVHNNGPAARVAQAINAKAFTLENNIVFAANQYAPETNAGQRLLAHELTHVIQQAGSQRRIARDAGEAREEGGEKQPSAKSLTITPSDEEQIVQREEGDEPPAEAEEAEEAAPAEEAPATATPTLDLNPGGTLTRGDTLTASVNFTAQAGETLNVTGWEYAATDHGDVTRPANDANFQIQWAGTMAVSGTMTLTYQVTPSGGQAGSEQTVTADITVNDRSGSDWTATVTDEDERDFGGQPSPPRRFNQLGRHRSLANPLPSPTGTTINSGPNRQFRYVSSLTAGTFISRPMIHPDLNNAQSSIRQFHQDDSVLFFVVNNSKSRIPPAEYSNFVQDPLSFDVPDWEAFYKSHNFYRVTATGGGNTVALQDAWWGLDDNAEDAGIEIRNDAAVRGALGIGGSTAYAASANPRGSWSGFALMPSAAILTGTQSHEYVHGTHSHRANFHKMMRALDPQRKIEQTVSSSTNAANFTNKINDWWDEITEPNHEIVDENASRTAEEFVEVGGEEMAGVNTDPDTGDFLGNVWNIHGNQPMQ